MSHSTFDVAPAPEQSELPVPVVHSADKSMMGSSSSTDPSDAAAGSSSPDAALDADDQTARHTPAASGFRDGMRGNAAHLWATLTLSEISGSLGDLGTLLPVLISLAKTGQISLSASLIFGGLYNIITGFLYGIPMCVQPMKAIAAVALASKMPMEQIVTAGFSVSAIILVLGLTRTIRFVNVLIPLAVVRGIQFGTGLTLVSKGVATIQQSDKWVFDNHSYLDNYFIAILAFLTVMVCYHAKRNPSALLIFIFGLSVAAAKIWGGIRVTGNPAVPHPGFSFPSVIHPSGRDFRDGFLNAGLGQLPLTALNSVVAVCRLADDLFPTSRRSTTQARASAANVTNVSITIGLMNIVGMWFGSMPFCHGSGGLAAQYRFGARTGTSMYVLGAIKLVLGLVFGSSLLALIQYIPFSILGVMLVAAGFEIMYVTRDLGDVTRADRARGDAFAIMVVTGCATSFWANDGVGFCIGMVAAAVFWVARSREEGRSLADGVRDKMVELKAVGRELKQAVRPRTKKVDGLLVTE
ncbi:hypothetical protein BDZ88DRAFT_421353 [Geranomyces variabilis]|nr:hypothetical protein BDZ88DRAFT_421353 [Geranomyces variabilis]KAJ3143285.1 hypothetical protein HDU90_000042 [Geranomyces variabilis]